MDDPVSGTSTMHPDASHVRLPREALDVVEWFGSESIRSVWPTRGGYLVITNLRCLVLARDDGVFRTSAWHAGTEYFYFNFAQPRADGLGAVVLSEEFSADRSDQVIVADPVVVLEALGEARQVGKVLWAERRARSDASPWVERPRVIDGPGHRPVVEVIAKAPCPYCGNLFDARVARCPFCRAPRGPG